MKSKPTLTKLCAVLLVIASVAALSLHVGAGSLEPENSPAPTMHTLGEVYNKIKQLVPENWSTMPSKAQVEASYSIHMTLEGQSQGVIPGSCTAQGREGTIAVVGNEHRVYIPYDSSGQPTGSRKHDFYTVIKYVDKSTPKLYRALCTGERMNNVQIKFYRINVAGQQGHYYTVTLENAIIMEIKEITPNVEGVSFSYRRITWTWEPDGIEYEDDLQGPV